MRVKKQAGALSGDWAAVTSPTQDIDLKAIESPLMSDNGWNQAPYSWEPLFLTLAPSCTIKAGKASLGRRTHQAVCPLGTSLWEGADRRGDKTTAAGTCRLARQRASPRRPRAIRTTSRYVRHLSHGRCFVEQSWERYAQTVSCKHPLATVPDSFSRKAHFQGCQELVCKAAYSPERGNKEENAKHTCHLAGTSSWSLIFAFYFL